MKNSLYSTIIAFLILANSAFGQFNNFSETVMRSTFLITDGRSLGTVIIMGRPDPIATGTAYYCLITATHVLAGLTGEVATLKLRRFENGQFSTFDYPLKIRNGNTPLWVAHPMVDVAAMNIAIPNACDIQLISTELLATDQLLNEFEIHPGDEVMVFGFPLGFSSQPGFFPVIRSARIAGYPLTPVASTATFLIDFEIFPGNSGGPVLFFDTNRFYKGSTHIGGVRFIMGIVSQEIAPTNTAEFLDETIIKKTKLKIGIAVHAHFVKELFDLLPLPKAKQ